MKQNAAKKKRPDMELSVIGPFFRKKRIEAGMSEQLVAEYLGNVSLRTLEQYETGQRSIPLSHIYALTNCLNISPELILGMVTKLSRFKEIGR